MLSASDVGVILEIFGFAFFLISAKKMPETVRTLSLEQEDELKVSKHWRYFYWELTGDKSQALRVAGIILIIIGLVLQISFFAE